MLLLADQNFGSGALARKIAAAEADFLIRVRTGNGAPKLPAARRLPDGSWLSAFGGVPSASSTPPGPSPPAPAASPVIAGSSPL